MNTLSVIAIIAGVIAFDVVVIAVIIRAAAQAAWNPIARDYPPVEPGPDARARRFQSFSLGMLNLGFCIHAAADADYLHLTPIAPLRRLGMRPLSLPRRVIHTVKPGALPHRRRIALGRGREIAGPAWCIDPADRNARYASHARSG